MARALSKGRGAGQRTGWSPRELAGPLDFRAGHELLLFTAKGPEGFRLAGQDRLPLDGAREACRMRSAAR